MRTSMIRSIFSGKMLSVFILGFSSGLPLLLIGGTLKLWMRDQGVDLTVIGIFSLVGLPYTLKFLWAPVMDRFVPPFLGRRRGWILICQMALIVGLSCLAVTNPSTNPWSVALAAFFVAFFSASQDIAIDAYRRDLLRDEELGLGSSLAVNGYRIGMLVAGALAATLADQIPWKEVYFIMAGTMGIGVVTTLLSPDPEEDATPPETILAAVVQPFVEYFRRDGAWVILAFIFLYKIGDSLASEMLNPFYLDMGFTMTQIGWVAKLFGFWATIIGGLGGGVLMLRLGIHRSLWIFGVLQAFSTLFFVLLARVGNHLPSLAAVVGLENLSGGMGTAAYVAYMASLCDRRFTATQYALLTSLMGVPRVIFGSTTGYLAKHLGWETFFLGCTLIAIPGMLLLFRVAPWNQRSES
jgi:PAT family beta-lactamase induction signal transducer AmpG